MKGLEAPKTQPRLLAIIGPGLLVAGTGVGAGDLATASFAGIHLGTAVLWAVLVGAAFKFVLNEGLARWQLATDQTLLEGVAHRLGPVAGWLFLPYLLLWSFFVGAALISACGVTLHAMVPVFNHASSGKIVFGIVASLAGLGLVLAGGFRLFEKAMSVCIGLMFVTVIATAAFLWPGFGVVARGLFVPTVPDAGGSGVAWTVALMGGVGGTVTVLCYGYWIREQGRSGASDLRVCRIDLGVAYAMTALFGIAMVIIGSTVQIEGKGSRLLVALADQLEGPLGPAGRWAFLIGALGAVFSSLLGVWQAVPYLFADVWRLFILRDSSKNGKTTNAIDTKSVPYRAYLVGIAIVPLLGLLVSFTEVQKLYAIIGAAFMPLLAVLLLVMNGRRAWVGGLANRGPGIAGLAAALSFFAWMAWRKWLG